jgi:hypothetical protein
MSMTVHLKRNANLDLAARASRVTDEATRRYVLESVRAGWYRDQTSVDALVERAPLVEVTFDD